MSQKCWSESLKLLGKKAATQRGHQPITAHTHRLWEENRENLTTQGLNSNWTQNFPQTDLYQWTHIFSLGLFWCFVNLTHSHECLELQYPFQIQHNIHYVKGLDKVCHYPWNTKVAPLGRAQCHSQLNLSPLCIPVVMGSFCDSVTCIWIFYLSDDRRGQWHVYLLANVVSELWVDMERQVVSFKQCCCLAAITGRNRSAADCLLWLLISSGSPSHHFAQTALEVPCLLHRESVSYWLLQLQPANRSPSLLQDLKNNNKKIPQYGI